MKFTEHTFNNRKISKIAIFRLYQQAYKIYFS